jgi:hypothetical protein
MRKDTAQYQQGLLVGENIVPIHLGGVRRRPGLAFAAKLPNQLSRISTGITATAPNGGTANNAKDDSEATLLTTTTDVGTTDPFVLVHYDLGAAKAVLFADAVGLKSTGGSSTEFRIQYSTDDASWTDFGAAFALVNSLVTRSYRRGGTAVTARYWRVSKVGGTDMGSVDTSLMDFTLWQDSGTISEARLLPFDIDTRYCVALTDRSMSIYDEDRALVEYHPAPYASADLAEIDADSERDVMSIVHEDYPPRFLLREVGGENFQSLAITFDAVPKYDYNDASSPTPTSEVQVITFASGWTDGDTFQIDLGGARTGSIAFAGDNATTAANIAKAVQKLYTVLGDKGVSAARTGALAFTVTFAADSADTYDLMTVIPLSSAAAATVSRTTAGVARQEPVWSVTRGYPRSTALHEGRLYFGGTKSLRNALLGSRVNYILDFTVGNGEADDAIFTALNVSKIDVLFAGRGLQVFTTSGEYAIQVSPVKPGDVPVNQTQYGCAKIRPVTIDGSTIFAQRTRKAVRDFRFDYQQDSFDSLSLSSLAPHLINDVVDFTAWSGSTTDELSLVFVVNGDGTMAILNLYRAAAVVAWAKWTTGGLFKAVAAVGVDRWFAIKRTVNSVDGVYLEIADDAFYTDCAVQVTPSGTTASGLSHLNGEDCRVRADGFVLDNATPVAGATTLDDTYDRAEVGLDWVPTITPMPLVAIGPDGGVLHKMRIVKARVQVKDTLGLLIDGKPVPDRKFDVDYFDTAATPVSGIFTLNMSSTWDENSEKTVAFSQVDPVPMELLGCDFQIEVGI